MQLISIKTHLVVFCLPVAARLSKILSAAVRVSELELDDDASVTHEIMAKGRKGETNGDKSICRTLKNFETESEALTSL
jgi:hypothetical protein